MTEKHDNVLKEDTISKLRGTRRNEELSLRKEKNKKKKSRRRRLR